MAIDYSLFPFGKGQSRFDERQARAALKAMQEQEVYAQVNARDQYKCRVCGRGCNVLSTTLLLRAHHHHLVYRSAGGATTTANICTLCAACHHEEHSGKLQLSGDADQHDPVSGRLNGIKVERPSESGWKVVAWA